jgi:hypothetical protein
MTLKVLSRTKCKQIGQWQGIIDASGIDYKWNESVMKEKWLTTNMNYYDFYLTYVVPLGTKLGRYLNDG